MKKYIIMIGFIAPLAAGIVAEAVTGIGAKTIKALTGGKTKRSAIKRKAKAKTTRKRTAAKSTAIKSNGTLKKGYRYAKGGRVVKAKAKRK